MLFACFVLSLALTCESANITVSDPTVGIKSALSAASPGDTVRVFAGTSRGPQNCDLVLSKAGLVVEAPDGPARTVVDCQTAQSRCLTILNVSATVSGFSFVNGVAPNTPATQQLRHSDADRDESAGKVSSLISWK